MTTYRNILTLSLAASLSMAASGAVVWAADQEYSDANRSWAHHAIQEMTQQNIMTGFSDGMFHPNAWVSRTEFSQMTAGALGLQPQEAETVPVLQNINRNAWSFQPIQEQPAVSAYPSGVTPPENPLRRVEALAAMAGVLNKPMATPKEADRILSRYADMELVPVDLRQAVATTIRYKIFEVEPDATKYFGGRRIDPLRPINRAETAALLDNLYHHRDISIVQNGRIIASAAAAAGTTNGEQSLSSAPATGTGGQQTVSPGVQQPSALNAPASETGTTAQTSPPSTTGQFTGAPPQAAQAPIGITRSQGSSMVRESQTEETGQATPQEQESKTGQQAGTEKRSAEQTASPELTTTGMGSEAANIDFYQGYGTPYRNSADTLPEFRTVNTTTTPATMDAAALQPNSIPINITFTGTVAKALYTAFNAQGDPVMLILDHPLYSPDGHMIAPAGSKVLGLVSRVTSHNRTAKAAELGFAFNGIITPEGQRIPINAVVNNADGLLRADALQGVVFHPNRSITALRREIHTSEGGMYGSKVGKAYVLEEPLVSQVSDKPLDAMDVNRNEIVLGVGDRLQLRSVESTQQGQTGTGENGVTPPSPSTSTPGTQEQQPSSPTEQQPERP